MKNWPKLSETLPHERRPDCCQSCAEKLIPTDGIRIWLEHDDKDQPTGVLVMLCARCETKLIEPHPRLYAKVDSNKPIPGAMQLCVDCIHRDGLTCKNPEAKMNGGPGLYINAAQPSRGFWDGRGKDGKRTGGIFEHWPAPPSKCQGWEGEA